MLFKWDSFSKTLRRFDAYPKTLEDFRIKTFSGATVTLVSGIIMTFLLFSELSYYWSTEVQPELFVDMSQGHKINININVTFPFLPCDLVSLDAIDISGQRQLDIAHTLLKQRLNKDGTWVDTKAEVLELTVTQASNDTTQVDPNRCESCFGAETKDITCCNTCKDVKDAYKRKGWAFPADAYTTLPQCKRDGSEKQVDFKIGEGCILYGHLEVNKVAGNFHVSPGSSFEVGHTHVHDMASFGDKSKVNVSHTINHLSFGNGYPGQVHPLDNLQVYAMKSDSAFQYYLKIVPTTYVSLNGSVVKTNQFSVTRHEKVVRSNAESQLPGMFVSYELSPLMVRYTEKKRSFTHFLTSVCAIVGGVFTVAGIFDSFIYHGAAALQRKMELGKLV